MTRVNLVPVAELHDQHLFAEWRELKMIPKSLIRSLAALDGYKFGFPPERARQLILAALIRKIPKEYVLNKGHVYFFYDKGAYLRERYRVLGNELWLRGYEFNADSPLDPDGVYDTYPELCGNYEPTPAALALIRERIAERVAMKPEWYRKTPVDLAGLRA